MLGFLRMLSQSGRLESPMLQIHCVLTNPLINGTTSLPNIGGPTRTRDQINTFHILRVDGILHRSEGHTNGVQGPKGHRDTMLPENPSNSISGPLNIRKMDTWNSFLRFPFSQRILGSFKESPLTQVSTITILNKDIKQMGFFILKALFVRDP